MAYQDERILIEPTDRWVRAQVNGRFVADSKQVLLVLEKGRMPTYYFPMEDVRRKYLEKERLTEEEEPRQIWRLKVGDKTISGAAWSYPEPSPEKEMLLDHIAFSWRRMDHWFEEEEEVFAHARDPYHRVDVMPSSRHVKIKIDGETVAESKRPFLLFETNLPTRYYLPVEDVRMELLEPTMAKTLCPYKGEASYWTAKIDEEEYRNIVWSYQDPLPECPKIKGLLSFYNEKVDLFVDGQLQERPLTPWG